MLSALTSGAIVGTSNKASSTNPQKKASFMAPPRIVKNVTWFDAKLTPQQRLEAYHSLTPKTKELLKGIGYQAGTVPTEPQMDALYRSVEQQAVKDLIRACSQAFSRRDLPSVNEVLRALHAVENVCVTCDPKVLDLAERVIPIAMEDIELKAYRAFRELPSSERYGTCLAASKALEILGLDSSTDYPVNPWPRCRVKAPMRPGPYVVVKGDTLSKISKRYYGEANLWDAIYESNGYSGHPDLIMPGLRLTIFQGP
jgi:nucleoid-associated protein YgaU